MRYTTIIDITEVPGIYRNKNARLVYLHLVLRSGYHDSDRDLIDISIRTLAIAVGLSVSATRHALACLERDKLISRDGTSWRILKWVVAELPTPRRQPKNAKAAAEANDLGARYEKELEERRQKVYNAVRMCSKEQLETWLKELEEGRSLRHYGATISPSQDNINWLRNVIKRL